MTRTIAVANHKGGVGKTTTVINLGAALAERDQRVLVVDADPQAHLTAGLGITTDGDEPGLHHLLFDDTLAADAVLRETMVPGLIVLPSCIDLSAAEPHLATTGNRTAFATRLGPLLPTFDYAIIDCPPSLGFLTLNALALASGVIIPVDVGSWALRGIGHLVSVINLLRQHHNPSLHVLGVLVSMYDARTPLSDEVLAHLRDYFGDRVFETVIRRTIRLVRASIDEEPMTVFEPRGDIAAAYRALAQEVMGRA